MNLVMIALFSSIASNAVFTDEIDGNDMAVWCIQQSEVLVRSNNSIVPIIDPDRWLHSG